MVNRFGHRRGVRRGTLTCLLAILLLSLVLPAPMAHALLDDQARDGSPADGTGADPGGRKVGIYITSLHDFDVADESFGVDYWL